MNKDIETYPLLTANRIQLRKPVAHDIPMIVAYANNPKIAEMTLNIPNPYRERDAIFWINMAYKGFEEKTKYIFIIERLSDNQFIGCIGLDVNKRFNRAELGYWIAEPHWNQGYASEATKEMLRFGFEEVDLNKIFGSHYYNNPASGKVMVHNGMIKEAELKEHIKKDGRYLSVIQYRLTKKEYNKKKDFQ